MNKYIKTDLHQAKIYMKAAIMNALHDIDSGEEDYIDLGEYLSPTLFRECLKESKWEYFDTSWEMVYLTPSKKKVEIETWPTYTLNVYTDESN